MRDIFCCKSMLFVSFQEVIIIAIIAVNAENISL
nr:MAG TPA: Sec-independent protein translocase protein TatB protein [Caudoviricetes sp.]DAM55975.1 MAG TPA: Sec-independent protein translocase protein TatB protein [Caudoviricetes sp.]DAW90002.1 MAG TPA: Sec-independent protein translocase protein TatB protein [Caudoviricetes sp.]